MLHSPTHAPKFPSTPTCRVLLLGSRAAAALIREEVDRGISKKMCPLRVILIFLSATVAGFFLLRGLNAADDTDLLQDDGGDKGSPRAAAVPLRSKVGSAVKTGFWTTVDMASGRYLWRTLVAAPAKSESDKAR